MIQNKRKIAFFGFLGFIGLVTIYSFNPYKLHFLGYYNSKVFAHRVNSIQKLDAALNFFKGVELDLVYIDSLDVLDVNHPPAASIQLNFKTYLETLKSHHKKPFLWLDIKNLKLENSSKILKRLDAIFNQNKYEISSVLIETQFPEALPIFREKGYKTSYYVPSNLSQKNETHINSVVNTIRTTLNTQQELALSMSVDDYKILKPYFPKTTKYLWAIEKRYLKKHVLVREALQDTTVKIVLAKFNALGGNR